MYVFFLLLVKEMVQTQYSTQTFFRDTLKKLSFGKLLLDPQDPPSVVILKDFFG